MGKLPSWVYELAEKVLVESIEYPTVLGESYREIVEYYSDVLKDYGVYTTIYTVPEDYARKHLPPEANPDKPRYILVARIGSGDRVLQFNGHYDVVSPGEGWSVTDPFKPKKVDNRVYGRGATDMKGGIAAFTAALAYLAQREPGIVVEAVYVPDEEIGGETGTGYLVNVMGSRPSWVVIAEPSGIDNIWFGHKGLVWGYVKVYGKQAHGSVPWLGDNAFIKMVRIAQKFIDEYLPRLREKKSSYQYDIEGGEYPTATLGGRVIAPGNINIVPGVSGFSIDRRLIVEERVDEVLRELREFTERVAGELGIKAEFVPVNTMNPALTDPSSKLIETLARVVEENIGKKPRRTVCVGGLDMRYYTSVGIETATYGPGEPSVPHKVDEYIVLDNLFKAIDIYVDLAYRLASE
ncbi:MAG: M20 family metallopeptidase [Thermoprotei archaeon]